MHTEGKGSQDSGGRRRAFFPGHAAPYLNLSSFPWLLSFFLLPTVFACGCAGFWDEVTSRDFTMKSLFVTPDPLEVLRTSNDGNARAKALRSLEEPLTHGGGQKEQDLYVQILTAAATSDRQPLCRLAAIKTLAHYKDPRAAEALDKAYMETDQFVQETNNIIKIQALTALGQTDSPVARSCLVRVAGEPPPEPKLSESEKQQYYDRRLTAIRALSRFTHYEVTETLVKVLRTEKDVAMRDRAHQSLQTVTGKKLPPDAKEWEKLLHPTGKEDDAVAQKQGRTWQLLSWRH